MSDSEVGTLAARVGVIGTSKRAASYFRSLSDELRAEVQVAALADPNGSNRRKFEELICPGSTPQHYGDSASMLADGPLDAVVIASPNSVHAEDAEQVMSRGIRLLLEKPVAVSVEECARLWNVYQQRPETQVFVGFVLRYTCFYEKIKQLIDAGSLGEILAIDADENVGTYVTNALHSGWRKNDAMSGGFIVEKCCHDLDILNWLVGAKAERVFSIGRRTHFVPRPASEQHPRFAAVEVPGNNMDYGDKSLEAMFFVAEDSSPYQANIASPDHQSVMVEYQQGTICTLTAVIGQPRPTRRIRIYGSDGSLSGDIDESRIFVDRPARVGNGWTREEIPVDAPSNGHHGGDGVIREAFWNAVTGRSAEGSRAGLKEGIESVLVGIAAERSRASGQPVMMAPMREEVFGPDLLG
ncbi:Gfo/Idh/MocA family protein [Phytoactinopolyspora limicola]|uniref:Gfo/Idh/MocA family protein n=1 Tax=Phytoactinopolyspora limicola TaxID=2715536 RepID=UPI00140C14A6|nr:Gfo/Idh/MocA family oxidoreductase [Phytoactinopolyspora limicola]